MTHHVLRVAVAAVVALFGGLVTAQSAQADIRTFPDVGGHITSVRVSHGPDTVGITAYDDEISIDAHYRFWIDTNSSNPGPEYKVEFNTLGRSYLMRVANFASSGIKFECEGFRAISAFNDGYAKVIIRRSCISLPDTVRVAVVGYYDENADGHVDLTDWAPGTEQFYPWVNR
jgi:hypothetical protein